MVPLDWVLPPLRGTADFLQLRAMRCQRIAQDVQHVFERRARLGRTGEVHAVKALDPVRATHKGPREGPPGTQRDRKSTRLNSSHGYISYAVFCLKKKKKDSIHIATVRSSPKQVS